MILNFSNLSHFTPSALTLTLTGAAVVSKGLSAVTISGNVLSYSPTSAEKSSLGSGLITAQVKLTASGTFYKSPIIQLDANDLDNEVLTVLTLSEDVLAALDDFVTSADLATALADYATKDDIALTTLSVDDVTAGTNVTINRFSCVSFLDLHWCSFSITTSASIASSAAVISGLPNATSVLKDFPLNSPSAATIANVRTNGTVHFGATTAAGTYGANFVYI